MNQGGKFELGQVNTTVESGTKAIFNKLIVG